MGIFSSPAQKAAKREAKRQRQFAASVIEEAETSQQRTQSAQEAQLSVLGLLGAPGTYDLPGTPGTAAATAAGATGIYKDVAGGGLLQDIVSKGKGKFGERKGIIDPEAYTSNIAGTAAFRIQSRMTAEAEQLLAEEGPLWDRLNNSITGTIMEGTAAGLRERTADIRRRSRRGGSAGRAARAEAFEMLEMERTNQARTNELWQANLQLHGYVRDYARQQQASNLAFVDNLPGISSAYQDTMNQLSQYMGGVAIPSAARTSMDVYQMQAPFKKNSTFLGNMVKGLIGVAGAAMAPMTGGLSVAVSGAITSGLGGPGPYGEAAGILGTAAQSLLPGEEGSPGVWRNPDTGELERFTV